MSWIAEMDRPAFAVGPVKSTNPAHELVRMAELVVLAAEAHDVEPWRILQRDRRPQVAYARQVAMWLSSVVLHMPTSRIGHGFGGRDHATVLHALRTVAGLRSVDARYLEFTDRLAWKAAGV